MARVRCRRYDSILGTFDADIKITGDDTMTVNGRTIKVVSQRNPLELPWKEMGIDIVIESTGVFIDEEGAGKHITAGAKRVVITAPGKGKIPTYVMGVNAHEMTGKEPIVSNASCTTNGMACWVKVHPRTLYILPLLHPSCALPRYGLFTRPGGQFLRRRATSMKTSLFGC
jgi:glyceraldehyde-3-phosphate dehydrogenase type I